MIHLMCMSQAARLYTNTSKIHT